MNYFEKITEGFRLKIKGCVSDNNSALQVKIIVSLSFKQPWIGESLTSMKKKNLFFISRNTDKKWQQRMYRSCFCDHFLLVFFRLDNTGNSNPWVDTQSSTKASGPFCNLLWFSLFSNSTLGAFKARTLRRRRWEELHTGRSGNNSRRSFVLATQPFIKPDWNTELVY